MTWRVLQRLHMGGWRLSTRIVVWSLLLLMLVQTVGYWVVRQSIESNARDLVTAELQRGQSIWLGLLEQNAAKLRQGAALISGDFGFNAAVADMHKESEKGAANDKDILVETIRDVLDTQGERIGPTVITALLDPQLQLIASNRTPAAKDVIDVLPHIVSPLANSKLVTKVTLVGDTAYQFVLVKMRAPLAESVLVGFRIDQAMAVAMKDISGLDVVVLTRETPDQVPHISLTTLLPKEDLADLQRPDRRVNEMDKGGDTLVTQTIDLQAVTGSAQTVLLRSLSQLLAPYEELKKTMWWITALGLLLFGLGSTLAARSVTQPLRSLADDATRLGDGEYGQPVHHTERRDEIGDLAKAFDQMRNDIADDKTQIERLAYWDDLTRLPNRLNFRRLLKIEMDQRPAHGHAPQPPLAVITLNLDRFKHVNDILGYAEGDQLLKAVATRLLDCVGDKQALVARLGGDEFSVLLHHADAEAALQVAHAIATAFVAPFKAADQPVDLNASMGIACWPQDAQELDTLLGRAEVAMYVAKRKNTGFQRYDPALDSSSKQTLSLLSELRRAVEHNQLRLFLQPKIALATGQVIAAEALVRWEHPERGLVPPDSFIPFAEQTGFVRQLTLWMFNEAARQWAGLQLPGQPLRISVNLSTRDLMALDFPDALDTLLAKHSVAPEGFCLEITESAIMDDPLRAEGTLNRLSERGFKLSIDDFGTGYSSLAYLKRLPVDELKIDKSFVMGMERDPDDAKIVRSTIDLAHTMDLSVVAEGVENQAIWNLLREQGCDEAQGYHMSRPLPVEKFKEWRERWAERAEI
ncbi:hypothetical protein os1_38800 [Comamonadaceae bacterium OS-1]|nr:hypothetical protein os1_38800 [Comamonadaceae bacterium OS-1]